MIEWLEFVTLLSLLKVLGALPRPVGRWLAAGILRLLLLAVPKLRKIATINLGIAFPDMPDAERKAIVVGMIRQLARMAVEFAKFPKLNSGNIERIIVLDGQENFLEGRQRGKGVIFLTGHLGGWELSSFAHAVYGFPLHFLARPLDNARLDKLIHCYRCLSGNQPVLKNASARGLLRTLHDGGTVGILADHNTMPSEGVFVDFFGVPACATSGVARLALHTDAAVVPGYACWDQSLGKYRLRFERPLELSRTGDTERDVLENTRRFAMVFEQIIRRYPEQWVWVHARWRARPPGQPPVYPFLD